MKKTICIILVFLCVFGFGSTTASAEETTDTTSNNIFDNPVGTGVMGNSDNYYYINSPFDPDKPYVYWLNPDKHHYYDLTFIDTSVYTHWIVLYDSDGKNLSVLFSDGYFYAKRQKIGSSNYVLLQTSGDKFLQITWMPNGYGQKAADGCVVDLPSGYWRYGGAERDYFIYSQSEYFSISNFRASSHDIFYENGLTMELIFPELAYSPVIKKGADTGYNSGVDNYQDFFGGLMNDIVEAIDGLGSIFNPLMEFFSEFWDEHVVGFLQTFIDNFTYYFEKFAIPDISFFEENFDSLYYGLSLKFPVLDDISQMYSAVTLAFENVDSTPNVSFTYQGVEYNLLNLELFDPVMPWVHSVILVFAYYRFLSGLYKKLPNYI